MSGEKDGGLAGGVQGCRVDERGETRGDDVNVLESAGAEMIGDPACAALDIALVLALGADARNAQKFVQLREMLIAVTVNELSKIHKQLSGDMSPLQIIMT